MLGCLCRKKRVQVYSGMPCRKELLSDLEINGHLVLITGVDGVLETWRFSPLFLFLFNPTAPVLGLFDQMEMWCYKDTILTRRWYFDDDRSLPEELPGVAAAFGFCDKKNVRIYHCVTIYALRDQPWNTCVCVYIFLINILCAGSKKKLFFMYLTWQWETPTYLPWLTTGQWSPASYALAHDFPLTSHDLCLDNIWISCDVSLYVS